jgi:hypothetical protein
MIQHIHIEMDLAMLKIDRQVYSFLDFVGVSQGLFFIAAAFLSLIKYETLKDFLVRNLYKQQNPQKRDDKANRSASQDGS